MHSFLLCVYLMLYQVHYADVPFSIFNACSVLEYSVTVHFDKVDALKNKAILSMTFLHFLNFT